MSNHIRPELTGTLLQSDPRETTTLRTCSRAPWIAALLVCTAVPVQLHTQQHKPANPQSAAAGSHAQGQRLFQSDCSGCHGLDGQGGERAPNIVNSPQAQKLSANAIRHIVSNGIPGTGMPSFRRLGAPAIESVTGYLRFLQGRNGAAPLPGNPQNGKALFFGASGCSACHMAGGNGGFIAPDLSAYAQTHSADQIRSAITNPAERNSQQGLVTAVTADGQRWEGIVRNEDNFSLQLQSTDGTFHFFSKADLRAVERASGSMMPSNYGSKLSKTQLNDLVSYLLSVGKTAVSPRKRPDEDE